jgi:chaperonin GroES
MLYYNNNKEGTNNMTLKPLYDRVLIRRKEPEAKTKGGLIIPDTSKEKPQEGEILAVGDGYRNEKTETLR